MRVFLLVGLFLYSLALSPAYAAQILSPSITGTLTVGSYKAHGPVTPIMLQHLLYDNLNHPLKLIFGQDNATVRNCAAWPNYTSHYEVDVGFPPNWNLTNAKKNGQLACLEVFFLEHAASGSADLNQQHPLDVTDVRLIPAYILPTEQSIDYTSFTVPEYADFKMHGTSMADLAASGDISISATSSDGVPSVHIVCTTDLECGRNSEGYPCRTNPKCGDISETLTEVARGDFLHTGTQQILVREDYNFPDAEQAYGYGYGSFYLLFAPVGGGKPYDVFSFSSDCLSSALQKNMSSEPVQCVSGWPGLPPPETPTISKALQLKPGFDCAKARTPLEHLICMDKGLAAQDAELNTVYAYAVAGLAASGQATLQKAQLDWLKSLSSVCQLPARESVPGHELANALACVSIQYARQTAALLPQYTISIVDIGNFKSSFDDNEQISSQLPIDIPESEPAYPAFGKDGVWYVTAGTGGATNPSCHHDWGSDCGAVYELRKSASGEWSKTIIYAFQGGETGGEPDDAQLTIGPDGSLYGTTMVGGGLFRAIGVPCQCGVVFRLSPPSKGQTNWHYEVLHSFSGYPGDGKEQGYGQDQPLTLGARGEIFGATKVGGPTDFGVVFELLPAPTDRDWPEALLYSFDGDPEMPEGITNTSSAPLTYHNGTLTFSITIGHPGFGSSKEMIELSPKSQQT